ncbi:hypothetical protein [Moraxella lacunata]|nr:hypothetical protein [Moraxella lacunata]
MKREIFYFILNLKWQFIDFLIDFLQDPKLKKTVRGEPCLPMTVFRHPQA